MSWQCETCDNDYCNEFVKNKKTHLCTHHYDVFKQFLNSGMNETRAQVYVEIDDTQYNNGRCRLAEKPGLGRPHTCNNKMAKGLGLCNKHLGQCSRRAREEGVPLPELIDAMVLEHENELRRLEQEMNRNVARRVEQRRAGQRQEQDSMTNTRSHLPGQTTPAPATQTAVQPNEGSRVIAEQNSEYAVAEAADRTHNEAVDTISRSDLMVAREARLLRFAGGAINKTNESSNKPSDGSSNEPEPEPANICSICHEECSDNPISCGHNYHANCLIRWMQSDRSLANTCPYCRAVILPAPLV